MFTSSVYCFVPALAQNQKSSLTYNLKINARESGLRICRQFYAARRRAGFRQLQSRPGRRRRGVGQR